jgi:polynucleotide 5'-kinase involved in rRNA processing
MPPMSGASTHEVIERASTLNSVMLIGAMDTGKSTLGRRIARAALEKGRTVAYVDADVGNSTIGPPACTALAVLSSTSQLDALSAADRLHFVGSITPDRLVLQHVIGTVALADEGRRAADLVIVDTTGAISGVAGETLKYHKVELIRPELVVALQRGGELEPIVGMLRRFLAADVAALPADPDVNPVGPDHRAARRADAFAIAFAPPLDRWRVRPTVFAPTLPPGLDLARLDGVLVGVQDGDGHCLGLGRLEYDEGSLRVLTRAGEGMQGLRLGSLRIDLDTFMTKQVNLRELIFGLER